MAYLSKAIDEVRTGEAKELKEKGYDPVLTKSRWLLLKRPENLTKKQESKLADLLRYNLRSIRSYLLKEEFQFFWAYQSPYWAGEFLDKWCTKTMRSKIEPMKKVARMLRKHRPLLLNWFWAKKQFSSGIVEGFNTKAKRTTRKAYGFKTYHAAEIALYHALGALPAPQNYPRIFLTRLKYLVLINYSQPADKQENTDKQTFNVRLLNFLSHTLNSNPGEW